MNTDAQIWPDTRIIAVTTLLHHYCFGAKRQAGTSEGKLAQDTFQVDKKAFNNFLKTGAPGQENEREKIAERLEKHYTNPLKFSASPTSIQNLVKEAFPGAELPDVGTRTLVEDVFARARSTREDDLAALKTTYPGFYDIYRFAAHMPGEDESEPVEVDGVPTYQGKYVRAVMEISPPKDDEPFATFSLRYKPAAVGQNRTPNTSEGAVLVVQQHLYFIGFENSSTYPLIICTHFNRAVAEDFHGLVLRYHDKGLPFASRVNLRKTTEFNAIDDADSLLGIGDPVEFPQEIQEVSDHFMNTIRFDGKAGLLLKGL